VKLKLYLNTSAYIMDSHGESLTRTRYLISLFSDMTIITSRSQRLRSVIKVKIVVDAEVQAHDVDVLNSVENAIINRFDGTALHITITNTPENRGIQFGNHNTQFNSF
jgi:ACT domain-containing protein